MNFMENQEQYGNITYGEITNIIVDTIGLNVILNLVSKEKKDVKKFEDAYAKDLQRYYKGDLVYRQATSEKQNWQSYIIKFFEEVLRKKYHFSCSAKNIIYYFYKQFINTIRPFTIYKNNKKKTVLYLLEKELLNSCYNLTKTEIFTNDINIKSENITMLLTDSYKKIFTEIFKKYNYKEEFYREIEDYYLENINKYPKLTKKDFNYKRNIDNWCNSSIHRKSKIKKNNEAWNPNWFNLEPILDYLEEKKCLIFVHRLILMYLLKNAQGTIEDNLGISVIEQNEILVKIITMLQEEKKPEEFYSNHKENHLEFLEQTFLIEICLVYQHQKDFNSEIMNKIISKVEKKCDNDEGASSEKFFSIWLNARAMVFKKCETLKKNKKEQDEIINEYKKALKYAKSMAGHCSGIFLYEIMLINGYCDLLHHKSRESLRENIYGLGYAIGVFSKDVEQKMIDIQKEQINLKQELIAIFNFCNCVRNYTIDKYDPSPYSINKYDRDYNKESECLYLNGYIFFEKKDYLEAIEYYTDALILNPLDIRAYYYLCEAYFHIHYWHYSLILCNLILLLDSTYKEALFLRGHLLSMKGQFEDAVNDFNTAIELYPEDPLVFYERGNFYLVKNIYKNAINDYNRAIEKDPNYIGAYLKLYFIYDKLGEKEKAQKNINKVKQIKPEMFKKK